MENSLSRLIETTRAMSYAEKCAALAKRPKGPERRILEEEIRRECYPWRYIAALMAEDIAKDEIPELYDEKEIVNYYRDELRNKHPEIFDRIVSTIYLKGEQWESQSRAY